MYSNKGTIMKAIINLKQVVGKELETITRKLELSYYDHRSFDDIVDVTKNNESV